MRAPIDGTLLMTQQFCSLLGGPAERYTAWRNGVLVTCIGHPAIDINCPTGTPVRAVKPGVVTWTTGDPFFGNFARLLLDTGEVFTYAHLSVIFTGQGHRVAEGDVIAASGSTGNSSGPHLHFAYRPAHPNYLNGFDGYEDPMTHFYADVYPLFDLSLLTMRTA